VDELRRNDAFDHELRRALAAGGGAPSGAHVDAEVAAAWIERRLDAAAQRAVETHLADCADCQTMLATLARISPDGDAVSGEAVAWWRRLRAGWVVPATVAAAAALVIWVAVPQQRQAPESTQSRAVPPPTPAFPDAAAPAATAPEADRKAANQPAAPAPPSAPSTVAPQTTLNLERRDQRADTSAPAPTQQPPAAAPPAAAPPAPAPAPPAESDKGSAKLEAEAPAVDARRERFAAAGESPARPASPSQDAAGGVTSRALDSLARVAPTRPSPLVIVAADGAARWRRTGGTLEFAPRGTAPFSATALPIAADAISAGSSPGGTVCWLVGRAGAVLVSADGLTFTRVTAPAPVDLVAVTAIDARTATVTASGGRRFRTTDAGATWSPQ